MSNYTFSENEKVPCHSCGKEMVYLSKHWQGEKYECDYPTLTKRQKEIIKGLIMGDASLSFGNSLPYLQMNLTNEEFLVWLKDELWEIGGKYKLTQTAKEIAQMSRESGWSENCKESDCRDVYQFRTTIHPYFKKYEDWYAEGGKELPSNLSLTKLEAKMWYCCDGDLKTGMNDKYKPISRITSRSESDNPSKLLSSFEEHGFEPYWEDHSDKVCFTVKETKEFLNWIGEAPPGFEYKWIN